MKNLFFRSSLLSILGVIFISTISFAEEKRVYVGQVDDDDEEVTLTLNVKPGEITDRINGRLVIGRKEDRVSCPINGFYESLTGNLVLFVTIKDKKKVITGRFDEDADAFYLDFKISKRFKPSIVAPRKQKSDTSLTGTWIVNDSSFFPVIITQSAGGHITGVGGKGFEDYVLDGSRTSDDDIEISMFSPDGTDDSVYSLKLCGSKQTMIGTTNSVFSPDAVWCRKGRTTNQECITDLTCVP